MKDGLETIETESSEARAHWLDLFTPATWAEFLAAGGRVSGFRSTRWKTLQQIRVGDYLLCYLTGLSRWIGVLEVVSPAYRDESRIWAEDLFPCRIGVKVITALEPETAVPILDMREDLSIFQGKSPTSWTGYLRASPRRFPTADAQRVVAAINEAKVHPVRRQSAAARVRPRPAIVETNLGPVTVPGIEAQTPESSVHTEIQWLLLKLGSEMGLGVWVARNDRSKAFDGRPFADIPRLISELPVHFDQATTQTIEFIDVLWVRSNTIVAAFEIESTTSIYSGLLRMSDLIAMQPNINIPLYLVAPDERRSKVLQEVNRPTFSRLTPPMASICRYIPFAALRDRIAQVAAFARHLKPDFLNDIAEACSLQL